MSVNNSELEFRPNNLCTLCVCSNCVVIIPYMVNSQDAVAKSVRKYSVGACGPRGFYGTIGEYSMCSTLDPVNTNDVR